MTREEEIKFRDECAMRVMQGVCSSKYYIDYSSKETAANAYELADAMLEEKKKRDEKLS